MTSYPKSSIKIALLENIHASGAEFFRSEGFNVVSYPNALNEDELIKEVADAHVLGIRSKTKITDKVLKASKKLMGIGTFCIGTDQVDLDSARLKGIPVFNAPFSNTRSVAELILAEMVMLTRRACQRSLEMHQGQWEKSATDCHEIRGKTLGIVGYGHIGSQVAVLAESFGMSVIYYDIISKMPMGNSRQVAELDDLLKISDFVTLHVPDTAQTRNMIGSKELIKMKKGAHLLNASRGSVVDVVALKDALVSGNLSGAAIDVFPQEPESNGKDFKSVLQNISNVILTPHIGGSTEEAQRNIGIEVASSLTRFVNNGSTTTAVNFPQVDLPVLKGTHRILNVHKNVPGVLKDINHIISDLGANIQAQFLSTDSDIGYLIVDLNKDRSEEVKNKVMQLPASIRTRILY